MNYFFLSDTRRDGQASAVYRFADLLAESACGCVVVTPDGTAPDWCHGSAPTVSEAWAVSRIAATDAVMFSSPAQYPTVSRLSARLLFYCLDADADAATVLADRHVTALTPWSRTAAVLRDRFGVDAIDVGLSIADVFFHAGVRKQSGAVALLSGPDGPSAGAVAAALPGCRFVSIDALAEGEAAAVLQASEFFLCLARGGRFPLAIVEALAAGCIVLSPSGGHAAECLIDGVNGVLAAEPLLQERLLDLRSPVAGIHLAVLCDRGRVTASAFRRARHGRHVAALLDGPLAFLRP